MEYSSILPSFLRMARPVLLVTRDKHIKVSTSVLHPIKDLSDSVELPSWLMDNPEFVGLEFKFVINDYVIFFGLFLSI